MNITRNARTLLVALLGATVLTAQTSTPPSTPVTPAATIPFKVPTPGNIHADYELVARTQLLNTMDGKRATIEWECYAEHDRKNDKPARRRTTWQVGTVHNPTGKELKLSLHDIGAQHRAHVIWIRLVPSDRSNPPTLEQTKVAGVPKDPGVAVGKVPAAEGNGQFTDFYKIDASKPDAATGVLDNKYELTMNDTLLRIEVVYKDHLPGDTKAQLEDGGPPSIPPIQEN